MVIKLAQTEVTASSGGTTSVAPVLGSAPTVGDLNIFMTGCTALNVPSAVAGTNITYTKLLESKVGSGVALWYGVLAATPNATTTGTVTAGTSTRATLSEWQSITSNAATATASQNTSTTTFTTASITPKAGQACLLIACCSNTTGALSTPTNGFTALATANTAHAYSYLVVASASGSYSTGWTNSLTANGDAIIAVFYGRVDGGFFSLI